MAHFDHSGIHFHYLDEGQGMPFIFQHGLGGDVNQPFGLFRPPAGVRMLAFDCRGHGETRPLGDPGAIGIASFADDLLAFMQHLRVEQAVVGGISMGAAIALNFALRHPECVLGLVLSRPAWLDQPAPPNLAVYDLIAQLIRAHGAREGLRHFKESEVYQAVLVESSDAANSLVGQFEHPRAGETVVKLERIPHDAPVKALSALQAIREPALLMANRQDPIHPYDYGVALTRAIPGAIFRELTPKSVSKEQHAADVQRFLGEWLTQGVVRSPHSSS
jgi:pimeloyl-ACP methyl ester carboxylesterase